MSSIQPIIEMIKTKAAERGDEIVKNAEKLREEKLLEARKIGKAKVAAMMVEAEIQFQTDSARRDVNTMLTARHNILEAKEVLATDILKQAIESLAKNRKTKRYASILANLIIEGGSALAVGEVELILPNGHNPQLNLTKIGREITKRTGIKTKVSLSKETIRAAGGVIVRSKDGTKWVDNTFEGRSDRMLSKIRQRIYSILFKDIDTSI